MHMDMGETWVGEHEVVRVSIYNCKDSVKYLLERNS